MGDGWLRAAKAKRALERALILYKERMETVLDRV
jgi:hypothetical protein